MYCRSCGAQNANGALTCMSCGNPMSPANPHAQQTPYPAPQNPYINSQNPYGPSQGVGQQPMGQKPENHLALSIFTTLCCCLILGIVAIVYASQVDSKWMAGDYQGAIHASDQAKKFCYIAIIGGAIVNIIGIGIQILLVTQAGQF